MHDVLLTIKLINIWVRFTVKISSIFKRHVFLLSTGRGKRSAALNAKSKLQIQIEEISSDEDVEEEGGRDYDVDPTLQPLSDDDLDN